MRNHNMLQIDQKENWEMTDEVRIELASIDTFEKKLYRILKNIFFVTIYSLLLVFICDLTTVALA